MSLVIHANHIILHMHGHGCLEGKRGLLLLLGALVVIEDLGDLCRVILSIFGEHVLEKFHRVLHPHAAV